MFKLYQAENNEIIDKDNEMILAEGRDFYEWLNSKDESVMAILLENIAQSYAYGARISLFFHVRLFIEFVIGHINKIQILDCWVYSTKNKKCKNLYKSLINMFKKLDENYVQTEEIQTSNNQEEQDEFEMNYFSSDVEEDEENDIEFVKDKEKYDRDRSYATLIFQLNTRAHFRSGQKIKNSDISETEVEDVINNVLKLLNFYISKFISSYNYVNFDFSINSIPLDALGVQKQIKIMAKKYDDFQTSYDKVLLNLKCIENENKNFEEQLEDKIDIKEVKKHFYNFKKHAENIQKEGVQLQNIDIRLRGIINTILSAFKLPQKTPKTKKSFISIISSLNKEKNNSTPKTKYVWKKRISNYKELTSENDKDIAYSANIKASEQDQIYVFYEKINKYIPLKEAIKDACVLFANEHIYITAWSLYCFLIGQKIRQTECFNLDLREHYGCCDNSLSIYDVSAELNNLIAEGILRPNDSYELTESYGIKLNQDNLTDVISKLIPNYDKRISIKYINSSGISSQRFIIPHKLMIREDDVYKEVTLDELDFTKQIYLSAYDENHDEERTFRIDRIQDVV